MNETEIIEMIQKTESATFTINGLGETTIQTKELDFLIQAYVKQIPKPIVGIKAQLQNRYCPSCNGWTFFDKYGQAKYCPTCGQAIDWSVKE